MGVWDLVGDFVEAVSPWSVTHAEAPAAVEKQESSTEAKNDEGASSDKVDTKQDKSGNQQAEEKDEAGDEQEDGAEEEDEDDADEDGDGDEDEDEDEVTDPKVKFEEECKKSKQCAPAKHHFDACVERVNGGAKEDCVEEFFHLAHCASQCAAPKLWNVLQ